MHSFFTKKPPSTQQTTPAKAMEDSRSSLAQGRDVQSILHLHRTIGNQAVLRLLQAEKENIKASALSNVSTIFTPKFSRIPGYPSSRNGIQTKLKLNDPGDRYEQEADRIADEVLRQKIPGGDDKKVEIIARVSQQESGSDREVNEELENRLRHNKGSGIPIPDQVRAFVEPRMQSDFSKVQIHTNNDAAQMNIALGARAFTHGRDIYFAAGEYQPQSIEGRGLITHELVHVVQQGGGTKMQPNEKFPYGNFPCGVNSTAISNSESSNYIQRDVTPRYRSLLSILNDHALQRRLEAIEANLHTVAPGTTEWTDLIDQQQAILDEFENRQTPYEASEHVEQEVTPTSSPAEENQPTPERNYARTNALINIEQFRDRIFNKIDQAHRVVARIGSAYACAFDTIDTITEQRSDVLQINAAIAFAILSAASVGTLAWISSAAQAARVAGSTTILWNSLEDALQEGVSEAIDVRELAVSPVAQPVGQHPQVFQNQLIDHILALQINTREYFMDVRRTVADEPMVRWDSFNLEAQSRVFERWFADQPLSRSPNIEDLPSELLIRNSFERSLWARWLPGLEYRSYEIAWIEGRQVRELRYHLRRLTGPVENKLVELGIARQAGVSSFEILSNIDGSQTRRVVEWARRHRPTPILEIG